MTEPARAPRIEFGTDGIRGIAGQYPLDPSTVLNIGRAIGRWLRARSKHPPFVVIGRDTRVSGPMLLHALISGLLAEEIFVYDEGILSTPGVAYLTRTNGYQLGIVISASHNPVNQNGIKIFGADGFKLSEDDEQAIAALIETMEHNQPAAFSRSFYNRPTRDSNYLDHLYAPFDEGELSNLKIVMDCANGAASAIAPEAFRRAPGADVTAIHCTPDGMNINHNAGSEAVRRDRAPLLSLIRQQGADFGVAFDGDADRVVFVTPEGTLVDGDHMLGILALELKGQGRLPGSTVVATEMSNSGLEHFLRSQGIALVRTKVGDKYVMDRMRRDGYALGGEQAGHVIILDEQHTVGDGIYVGLLVSAIAARHKRQGGPSLHDMACQIPRYPQVIASAHLARRADLLAVPGLDALVQRALNAFEGKGRVNVRFSGTEPNLLRAMVEGGPQTSMAQVLEHALAVCKCVARETGTAAPVIDVVDCMTGAPVAV